MKLIKVRLEFFSGEAKIAFIKDYTLSKNFIILFYQQGDVEHLNVNAVRRFCVFRGGDNEIDREESS